MSWGIGPFMEIVVTAFLSGALCMWCLITLFRSK